MDFIYILLKVMNIFIIAVLKSLPCVSAMLHFSGLTVVGFLSFGKNILSCVLMIVASGFGIVDIDICSCLCWLGIPFLDSVAPPGS